MAFHGARAPRIQLRATPFEPGSEIVLRSIRDFDGNGPAVGFAVTGTVVVDDSDVMAVCTVPDSAMRTRAGRGSGPTGRVILPRDWHGEYHERGWSGHTVVRVHRAGDPWSVWRWHDGSAWLDQWYGNLESPWQRTVLGFDTQDWALDVVGVGHPGTAEWRVASKDEDELDWMVEQGTVTAAQAAEVREAGAELTRLAVAGGWPFDADWGAWVPDPGLVPIPMPEGWSRV